MGRVPAEASCGRWVRAALVTAACGCYLGVAVSQLTLPGLEYDEVFFGPAALGRTHDFSAPSALEPVARFSPLASTAFLLSVGDYALPVMLMPYWGALKVYLQAPVFALWGASPWTIRLPAVALGAFTLWLFARWCARLFSPAMALLALILLASDPSYVFYTRHDLGGAAVSLLLVVAPLWCLACWSETSGVGLWSLAFFLFGLGLYHRLDYLGFLAAVGTTALVCFGKPLLSRLARREVFLAGVFFVLGCSPLLFFVWQRPSLAATTLSLAAPAQDFSSVARLKGYVLWTVLNGTSLYDFFTGRSGVNVGRVVTAEGEARIGSFVAAEQSLSVSSLFTGTLTPYCLLFFGAVLWFFHPPPALKTLGVLLAVLLLCLLVMPGALRGHHFAVFLPVAQAFLASSLLFLRKKMQNHWARATLVALGVACVGANLAVNLRYHRFLAATGGRGIWSEAIYDLSHYLQEHCAAQRCFIGDWGMGTQVVTLAGGSLAVEEVFWPYLQGGDEGSFERLVRTEPALFIFYADPYVNFSRPKRLFFAAARKAERRVVVDRVFRERDGTPVIEVVKAEGSN